MKNLIKNIFRGIIFILVLPSGLLAQLFYKLFQSQTVYTMFAECYSSIPSFPGHMIRACYYKQTLAKSYLDLYTAYGCYISKINDEYDNNTMCSNNMYNSNKNNHPQDKIVVGLFS